MGRCGEGKVGQAIVDQIDNGIVMPEPAVAPGQLCRVANYRLQAVAFEQLAEQQEFRVEVLLCRRLIDNRY